MMMRAFRGMSKTHSIVLPATAASLPQATRSACLQSAMSRTQFFHRLAPLWIGAGAFLAIVIALFAWDGSPFARIVIASASGAAITLGLSLHYYITFRNEAMRKCETIALVNHHIRNALQTMHLLELPPSERTLMHDASGRIQWTLREVLNKCGQDHNPPNDAGR